jgi:hypothetical protein
VTITIAAVVNADVAPGTIVSNSATIAFDADGNGTNETTGVSDDPATPAIGDPTTFLAAAAEGIPAAGPLALTLLAILLAFAGAHLATLAIRR